MAKKRLVTWGNKISKGLLKRKENLGYINSPKTRKKMSKAKKGYIPWNKNKSQLKTIGENNPNWKGGISRGYKEEYGSLRYRLWRESVFNRDKYICQNCGFSGNQGYLTAHHIKSWAKYPELRFNIENGLTLCEECHKLTDNYKGRAKKRWPQQKETKTQ